MVKWSKFPWPLFETRTKDSGEGVVSWNGSLWDLEALVLPPVPLTEFLCPKSAIIDVLLNFTYSLKLCKKQGLPIGVFL
jgi:hypothetical protein